MSSTTLHPLSYAHTPLSAGPGTYPGSEFEDLDTNMLLSAGHPAHCMVYPVTGDSNDPHIPSGSLVVVDKLIEPLHGHTVAVYLDGLNHIKILHKVPVLRLVSSNKEYAPIEVREWERFEVLGVVTWCIQPITRTISY